MGHSAWLRSFHCTSATGQRPTPFIPALLNVHCFQHTLPRLYPMLPTVPASVAALPACPPFSSSRLEPPHATPSLPQVFFHGCSRSAKGFFPYDPKDCPECLGEPGA